ncbi:MAG: class I tRNA ligase family protein [Eubacteriales bacterium]
MPTSEPYMKRTSHGMVLGSNGEKMSKTRGNVVNPDDYIPTFGADSFRTYIMFMGAFDHRSLERTGTRGCRRFLDRVWALQDMLGGHGRHRRGTKNVHATIKKVGEDYERMKFNTAIAAMMALTNDFYAKGKLTKDELHTLVLLLAPVAPHICEEINESLGYAPLHNAPWPVYDESALVENEVEYGVQVNGKVRGRVTLSASLDTKAVEAAALACEEVKPYLEGKTVRKIIVVRNIVNIVVG